MEIRRPPGARRRVAPRRGATLVELLLALSLAGVLLGLGAPLARDVLDRTATVAAREEALGLVHRARALALTGGAATLHALSSADALLLTDATGRLRIRLDLGPRGVDLRTTGVADSVAIRWNALGWGTFASRTLEFRRGGAASRLVVSSRGRAERR